MPLVFELITMLALLAFGFILIFGRIWVLRNMEQNMRAVVNFLKQKLYRDEDGASLIEYTVLLAILLIAVIAIIVGVGGWISSNWASLSTAI